MREFTGCHALSFTRFTRFFHQNEKGPRWAALRIDELLRYLSDRPAGVEPGRVGTGLAVVDAGPEAV
jgi:hypothetical protein